MATFVAKTAARKLLGKKLQDKFGQGVSVSAVFVTLSDGLAVSKRGKVL